MSKKLPFEKVFPYFSYRWRYNDGQYSPYAPFTKVNFIPKAPDIEEFFRNGHNTSITNILEQITLDNIDKGGPDVEAVDILYTESISSTIYVLKTIDIPESERGNGSPLEVQVKERSFGAALPANQLTRHFDSVPRKAKAQETTANRIFYGNYIGKYNQNDNLRIKLDTKSLIDPLNGPALKTNRTYEVGVSYIDKFGRIGGILTQKAPDVDGEGSSIKTSFTQLFRPILNAKILSDPPEWAKFYRYYVKDIAGEHFNLTGFNIYNDGTITDNDSDNVYVQFNSTDRNKITEDTILIPRRHTFKKEANGKAVQDIFLGESRHPVLAIENEAPDIVKSQVKERSIAGIGSVFDSNHFDAVASSSTHGQTSRSLDADIAGDSAFILISNESTAIEGVQKGLNDYILAQNPSQTKLDLNSVGSQQAIDCTGFAERLAIQIKAVLHSQSNFRDTKAYLVDTVTMMRVSTTGTLPGFANAIKFNISNELDDDGNITTTTGGLQLATTQGSVVNFQPTASGAQIQMILSKLGISEAGSERLKGSFFVKIPRTFANDAQIATVDRLISDQTTGRSVDGKITADRINEINFETEPILDSQLDIYFEGSKTYQVRDDDGNIIDHGEDNLVEYANCIATCESTTSQVYLESRRVLDKFNTTELAKGIRATTPEPRYAEEHRKTGLIFSGLFNSRTSVNELNQFSLIDGITKEIEPNYGGIQKLYALDTNLLTLAEDKVFKILANKDALFNADDGANVTATNRVLGQAIAYQGNYGISTHPESFVYFRNNVYFADAKRGGVIQLTPANGQMFPISSKGMSNFFRDRLGALQTTTATDNDGNVFNTAKILGLYDGHKKNYIVSIQGYNQSDVSIGSESIPSETSNITVAYSLNTQGWTTRCSFIPETGITVHNKFFTFKNGLAYLHHSNLQNRNTFYNTLLPSASGFNAATGFNASEVQIIFNDNPSFVSDWLALNYEGTTGWLVPEIIGEQDSAYNITNVRLLDSEESNFNGWFLKEGKYYGSIVGTQPVYIVQPGSSIGADGFYPLVQSGSNTQDVSGTKGFFLKARFKNESTSTCELASVGSEYYISQA